MFHMPPWNDHVKFTTFSSLKVLALAESAWWTKLQLEAQGVEKQLILWVLSNPKCAQL